MNDTKNEDPSREASVWKGMFSDANHSYQVLSLEISRLNLANSRLRAEVAALKSDLAAEQSDRHATKEIARQRGATINALCSDIADLKAENAKANAERDAALLQLQRIRCEISCRVEHGADSNGHLEAIRKMMQKEVKP